MFAALASSSDDCSDSDRDDDETFESISTTAVVRAVEEDESWVVVAVRSPVAAVAKQATVAPATNPTPQRTVQMDDDQDDSDFPGQQFWKPLRKPGNASKPKSVAAVRQRNYAMDKRQAQRDRAKPAPES